MLLSKIAKLVLYCLNLGKAKPFLMWHAKRVTKIDFLNGIIRNGIKTKHFKTALLTAAHETFQSVSRVHLASLQWFDVWRLGLVNVEMT